MNILNLLSFVTTGDVQQATLALYYASALAEDLHKKNSTVAQNMFMTICSASKLITGISCSEHFRTLPA